MHCKFTPSEKLSKTWAQFYDLLLNLVFYLACGGENCFRRKCLNFASPVKGDHVLDVCCGTGVLTSLIAGFVGSDGQVIGVDICESALDIARTKTWNLPVTFLRVNVENLPFASSRFDRCFISFGLHHMLEQARQNTLREIRRTLTSTGSLFVVDYNLPDRALARLAAIAFAKLDKSQEAYKMMVNHSTFREIQQAGFEVRRREFICKGMIQLVEAVKN